MGRLLELSSEQLGRSEPFVLPPRLFRRWVHPWLRRKYRGLRRMEVYFPYFLPVRFDDTRLGPGPRVELLPPPGSLRRASSVGPAPSLPLAL